MNLCAESFTIYASLSNIYFSSFIYDCFYRTLHHAAERTICAQRPLALGNRLYFPPFSPPLDFSLLDETRRENEPRDRRRPPRGQESAGAQSEWTVGPHHHSCPGYAPLLTALIVGQLIIAMFPVFRRYSTHLTRAVIRFWGAALLHWLNENLL